jgi:hypothetical protein
MLFQTVFAMLMATVASGLRAADFSVVNTNNSGTGSLRQAILDANTTVGADRIVFNIPDVGLQIIRVTNAFPALSDPVEIDGYTQAGSSPNTLTDADNAVRRIELVGIGSLGFHGFILRTSNSVIRGLSMRRFNSAIEIQGSHNLIVGNVLGSDASPTYYTASSEVPGNGRGLTMGSTCCDASNICCNIIGGVRPADRNVIAGNLTNPIRIGDGVEVADTTILGNFIGVDSSGRRPSGGQGSSSISVSMANGLTIGGLEEGARNVMASYWGSIINLYENPDRADILGNYLGVGADGSGALFQPARAVQFSFAGDDIEPVVPANCRIEANRIAHCFIGVDIPDFVDPPPLNSLNPWSVNRITLSKNNFYANTNTIASAGGLAATAPLYLGPYARTNDFWDLDTGANNRQNYPEISSVSFESNTVVIVGALNTGPASSYRVEFFANTVPHPSGFGEGETYLGYTNVTTDANGSASYEFGVSELLPLQPYITATATDSEGNTSMFSRPVHGRSAAAVLFHLQPTPASTLPYANVSLVADATGAEPLVFQWRRNGIDIPNATNLALTLSNIVWDHRGSYTLVASNAFGAVESLPAEVSVIPHPTIHVQPTNAIVFPGTNVTFTVLAGGMQPIAYQWRRDGVAVSGATSASLFLPNVDWPLRGEYTVVLSNAFGVTESEPAGLFVKIRPGIAQQPISQNVVTGGTVTLSVAISNSATLPLTYLWRSNSTIVLNDVSMSYHSFLTLSNVQASAGYTAQVTNIFGPPGVLSARANLTVLADADHDGLPDVFEDAYQFDRNNPADATLDSDGDGLSNAQEYTAGTDPQDALNRLRLDRIGADNEGALLEFAAKSNKTYSLQFRELLGTGGWMALTNLPARSTNALERVTDGVRSSRRFYRLVTPNQN